MTAKNNISKLTDCYGCGVCSAVCPVDIIDIKESRDGFYVPTITDNDKCIECGLCLKSCSFDSEITFDKKADKAFASWSNDEEVRYRASSGGVAYEIARRAIKDGYKFCGVRYDSSKRRAIHYICSTEEELKASMGSKYIPSYTEDAFKELLAKTNKSERYIVFGLPCQIASLRLALQRTKREDNFILVDIYCHGVPSLKVWDKYLNERPETIRNLSYTWRDKKQGWHKSYCIVGRDDNDKEAFRSNSVSTDPFFIYFFRHYALSPCCLDSCKYKKENSLADIRLGDLWGEKYKNNEKGVSGILCMTDRGAKMVEATESIHLVSEPNEVVTEGQMAKNASKPTGYKLTKLLLRHTSLKSTTVLSITRYYNFALTLPGRVMQKVKTLIAKG